MSDGYQKQRLTNYLTGANEKAIGDSGKDWQAKGELLQAVSEALQKRGPELSEKLGKDSKTAAELKTGLLASATSMDDTGGKLKQAGAALLVVGDNLEKARVSRKAMKTLVEPPPYNTPSYNGAQPTPEQIEQDAKARAASNREHSSYQSAHAGQEAEAAEITANLDQAFLSAIPPMMAIHGGPDPTAPTGDKNGPGSNAPPPVNRTRDRGEPVRTYSIFSGGPDETDEERREREERERERREREREERERERREREERLREERERLERERLERERLERERLERERLERLKEQETTYTPKHPTTNVAGGTDSGTTYHGVSDGSSVSGSAGSTSAGVGGAAAAGAAGAGLGAGAMKGGAIGGSAAAPIGGTVRGIGAGGQSPSSSFSRASTPTSAGARGGAASGTGSSSRSTAAGSASRSAGAGSRAGAAGSTSRGAAGKGAGSAGRSGAAGSTSGKGSAKGKGKGLFRRGSNGSTSGGRSNKKDEGRNTQRDALVYEQDWLGDETAAPSVLD